MLTSALRHYRQQQRVAALAVRAARRSEARGLGVVASAVVTYQAAAIEVTLGATGGELAEQGIAAPAVARVVPTSLLTPVTDVVAMLDAAATSDAFDRLVATLVNDAGRTAAAVDIARRPAITGHIRSLNLPSCSRCVVLAGRVYRHSEGFRRHPLCDCLMTPTTEAAGLDLVTDPQHALAQGMVKGLSKGDLDAIEAGADLGQVVNVRRRGAGLTVGSSVMERAGRLTPQGVMRVASDRTQAVELLTRFGYLR